MRIQSFAKVLILLIAGVVLISCAQNKMKEVMTFEMYGDCMVIGPWEDPIPSKGTSIIQVLRPTKNAEKGYLPAKSSKMLTKSKNSRQKDGFAEKTCISNMNRRQKELKEQSIVKYQEKRQTIQIMNLQ